MKEEERKPVSEIKDCEKTLEALRTLKNQPNIETFSELKTNTELKLKELNNKLLELRDKKQYVLTGKQLGALEYCVCDGGCYTEPVLDDRMI